MFRVYPPFPGRPCIRGTEQKRLGMAQLVARLIWDQEVAGSNPATQTMMRCREVWSFPLGS